MAELATLIKYNFSKPRLRGMAIVADISIHKVERMTNLVERRKAGWRGWRYHLLWSLPLLRL